MVIHTYDLECLPETMANNSLCPTQSSVPSRFMKAGSADTLSHLSGVGSAVGWRQAERQKLNKYQDMSFFLAEGCPVNAADFVRLFLIASSKATVQTTATCSLAATTRAFEN